MEETHTNEPCSEKLRVPPISVSWDKESETVVPRLSERGRPKGLACGAYVFDEVYVAFQSACRDWGMNLIDPEDFQEAWRQWRILDSEQRQAAIDGIRKRIAAGEESFGWKPKNYLRKHEWKRPIKPRLAQKPVRTPERSQLPDAATYLQRIGAE